ncbi:MAG: hypothetical protein AAGD14_00320 [Planctomycetota bacterium]
MRLLLLSLLALAACNGGVHREGDRMFVARGLFTAHPIKGNAIAWNGERDNEYFGAGVGNYWFVRDRVALGVLASVFNVQYGGDNILVGQVELAHRWYLFEHEKFAYFWDSHAGFLYGEDNFPEGATRHEATFAFGPGMEIPLSERNRLLAGIQFHHASNARGRAADDNPSQNDLRIWLAWGFKW